MLNLDNPGGGGKTCYILNHVAMGKTESRAACFRSWVNGVNRDRHVSACSRQRSPALPCRGGGGGDVLFHAAVADLMQDLSVAPNRITPYHRLLEKGTNVLLRTYVRFSSSAVPQTCRTLETKPPPTASLSRQLQLFLAPCSRGRLQLHIYMTRQYMCRTQNMVFSFFFPL